MGCEGFGVGVRGVRMVRMGDGVENRHKRHGYERSSISHLNNVHLEYANTAYNTHYKHTFKALGTIQCGDKRAAGHDEKAHVHARARSILMDVMQICTYRECFCVTPY